MGNIQNGKRPENCSVAYTILPTTTTSSITIICPAATLDEFAIYHLLRASPANLM
jgi:hypothetical protein